MRRSRARARDGRILGVALAILSLVQTPLPQPDFHNIRHHDAPGEVCEDHDHLLRWHPGAKGAEDVSVLHWHWFVPSSLGDDTGSESGGPAVHAHRPWQPVVAWDEGPAVAADTAPRPLASVDLAPLVVTALPPDAAAFLAPAQAMHPSPPSRAAAARSGSLTDLLQRWVC